MSLGTGVPGSGGLFSYCCTPSNNPKLQLSTGCETEPCSFDYLFEHIKRPDVNADEVFPSKDTTLRFANTYVECEVRHRMVALDNIPTSFHTDGDEEHHRAGGKDFHTHVQRQMYEEVVLKAPVVDMYGVVEDSLGNTHSACVHIHGKWPWFLVQCDVPANEDGDAEKPVGELCRRVFQRLELLLSGYDPDERDWPKDIESPIMVSGYEKKVMDVTVVSGRSMYGYHPSDYDFLKITLTDPNLVPKARRFFQRDRRFQPEPYGRAVQTFESDVPFVSRCMVDAEIKGMGWSSIPWKQSTRVLYDTDKTGMAHVHPVVGSVEKWKLYYSLRGAGGSGCANAQTFYEKAKAEAGLWEAQSQCQIEVDVHWTQIKAVPLAENAQAVPKIRYCSMDIEVSTSVQGRFPNASNPGDRVIMVANWIFEHGKADDPFEVNVFVLGGLDEEIGVQKKWGVSEECVRIYGFQTEEELLVALSRFYVVADIDIFTGYNIIGFDFRYLFERASTLRIEKYFNMMGRSRVQQVFLKHSRFQSNAYGTKELKVATISGRILLCMQECVMRDVFTCRFRSFKLNNVSRQILTDKQKYGSDVGKEPVHYTMITGMWKRGGKERRDLVVYNITDVFLPAMIMQAKCYDSQYIEQARLYGINLMDLILRGQQARLVSLILTKAIALAQSPRRCQYYMPYNVELSKLAVDRWGNFDDDDGMLLSCLVIGDDEANDRTPKFQGAIVLDPIMGFYKCPVSTLDFGSLYPNLMRAHNLCPTTWVPWYLRSQLKEGIHYFVAPSGHAFMYPSVHRGFFVEILDELLDTRQKAKDQMRGCAYGSIEYNAYDGKQQAVKQGANSVYGFAGAMRGRLACIPVSETVTSFGREYIESTKAYVESLPDMRSPEYHAYKALLRSCESDVTDLAALEALVHFIVVIYGDTDSVMNAFMNMTNSQEDLLEASRISYVMEEQVNARLYPKYVKQEYEAMKCPYVLLTKKRYASIEREPLKIPISKMFARTRDTSTDTVPVSCHGYFCDRKMKAMWLSDGRFAYGFKPAAMKAKGLMSVRRDNAVGEADLIIQVQAAILGYRGKGSPLQDPEPKLAVDIVHNTLREMYVGDAPISRYVMSKGYKKRPEEYKVMPCHMILNERMATRSPGSEASLGERIPYCIVRGREKKIANRAEDPGYIVENGLSIDLQYYIKRLIPPLVQMLTPVLYPNAMGESSILSSLIVQEEAMDKQDRMHIEDIDGQADHLCNDIDALLTEEKERVETGLRGTVRGEEEVQCAGPATLNENGKRRRNAFSYLKKRAKATPEDAAYSTYKLLFTGRHTRTIASGGIQKTVMRERAKRLLASQGLLVATRDEPVMTKKESFERKVGHKSIDGFLNIPDHVVQRFIEEEEEEKAFGNRQEGGGCARMIPWEKIRAARPYLKTKAYKESGDVV